MASPLSALHMKASDSCKIQVISYFIIDIVDERQQTKTVNMSKLLVVTQLI